jgi:ubiquinone/menaquinone biosynthesis C-methylase UbiE
MNAKHAKLCGSPEWAEHIKTSFIDPLRTQVRLGHDMLEIGPGPGAATAELHTMVGRLTLLESDRKAVGRLKRRYATSNVTVLAGDARTMPFDDSSFDSVAAFTMLHHIPTIRDQDRVLSEVLRVLRPDGVFVGADSLPSNPLHAFHSDDDYNPVEPAAFLTRLSTIGFGTITLHVGHALSFIAIKDEERR